MTMPPLLSVVTSTRNPRPEYLRRVIDALKEQSLPKAEWEYVLVDNGSDEPVSDVAEHGWHERARLEHEARPGLTWGRLRGIAESSGELIVFVDDDNVLAPNYLERTLSIAERFPFLGAWGGSACGEFESPVPPWMRPLLRMLAVREVTADCWSNLPFSPESMPTGAGLTVRRAVAHRYRDLHRDGFRPIVLDRTADSLGSAGDEDLAACACEMGMGVGVFSELSLVHLIPRSRLEVDYAVRLTESIAWSDEIRRAYHGAPTRAMKRRWQSRVADALRTLTSSRRERLLRAAERQGRERGRRDVERIVSPARD